MEMNYHYSYVVLNICYVYKKAIYINVFFMWYDSNIKYYYVKNWKNNIYKKGKK